MILKNILSTIPEGTSFSDFFKEIWETEKMNTVMMYGYFQISCVAEAFKSIKRLPILLKEVGCENIDMTLLKEYSEEINSD